VSGWTVAFCASLAAVALATGLAFHAMPRWLPLPGPARFLVGVALAPQLLGLLVLMVFATAPGAPWWVVHALLVAVTLLALVRSRIGARRLLRVAGQSATLQLLPLLALAGLFALVIELLATNARAPLIAFDAIQYAREASLIAADRSMDAWVGHAGTADGRFRGDIHHPVYSGYLAWAQQFDAGGGPGVGDGALRWAFQATILSMLLALPVAGLALRWGWWAWAVVPLVLLVPQFDYVSSSASRDAFRIVPVVGLAAVLLRLARPLAGWRSAVAAVPALTVLGMLALMGHTLNGFVVVSMLAGWGCWALLARRRLRLVVPVGLAAALGLLAGGWTYADAWLTTRSIHGSGVLMYGVLEGTPMLQVIRALDAEAARGVVKPISRLSQALLRDGRWLAPAAVAAAAGLLAWALLQRRRLASAPIAIAVVTLVLALPVLGAFDLFGYEVSQWFVTNQRYALHWYFFLALALLAPVVLIDGRLRRPRTWAPALVLAVLCAGTWHFTLRDWYRNTWDLSFVENRLHVVRTAEQLIPAGRLVLEDARWNYYLGNRHAVMYAPATRGLFLARTDDQAEQALRELGAAGLLLTTSLLGPWWSHSAMHRLVENRGCRLDLEGSDQTLYLLPALARVDCAAVRSAAQGLASDPGIIGSAFGEAGRRKSEQDLQ